MKVETNTSPSAKLEKRGFEIPLFELPNVAMPGFFRELAEQSVVRAKENCEKMKAASGDMADVLRETYSTNVKSAADYGVKVIEISTANTTSALDFLANLIGTKTLSEVMTLSAAQARKNFDTASAQNKELWDLARKVTTETAEPINKSVARVLQNVA